MTPPTFISLSAAGGVAQLRLREPQIMTRHMGVFYYFSFANYIQLSKPNFEF